MTPTIGEIEEATKFPNGYIYRIDERYEPGEDVPPDKILGAWKVGESGKIIGEFIPNKNYKP